MCVGVCVCVCEGVWGCVCVGGGVRIYLLFIYIDRNYVNPFFFQTTIDMIKVKKGLWLLFNRADYDTYL